MKDAAKLPKAALDYLRFIADFLQVEIGMISTGPERDATIIPAGHAARAVAVAVTFKSMWLLRSGAIARVSLSLSCDR